MKTECQYFSDCQKSHVVTTLSRDSRWKVGTRLGTCCEDTKREDVATTVLLRERLFFPRHVAWHSTGLNSCVMKQGQNDLQCRKSSALLLQTVPLQHHIKMNQYLVRVHQLVFCLFNTRSVSYTRRGLSRVTSPQHVPSVCRPELSTWYKFKVDECEDLMSTSRSHLL